MKYGLLLILLVNSSFVFAQICNNNIKPTAVEGRFIENKNGTISDAVNLLIWDKCSYGQVSSGNQCLGIPTEFSTWKEALELANSLEGKYLPNVKELGALIERSCINPAIALNYFPDTPLAMYWTNSPDSTATETDYKGRIIDFTDGGEFVRDVSRPKYIRLLNDIGDE